MTLSWTKKLAGTALAASIFVGAAAPGASAAGSAVTIVLDRVPLTASVPPIVTQGATMVPFRTIAEALGISVAYDAAAKTVRATGKDAQGTVKDVRLKVGQSFAAVNGAKETLSAAPVMKNGSVLIPLAFFSRQFGAQVDWNGATKTVTIVSPQRAMRLLGFYAISSYDQRDLLSGFNEVAFGWSQIDDNGVFTLKDANGSKWRWPDAAGDVTPESIVGDVNAQGSRAYLAILAMDGKRQLTKVLTDKTLRDSSIAQLHELAVDNGFGGILLDFEGLGWQDDPKVAKAQLNAYVKQLVETVAPDGIKVSLAVPPPNSAYKGYDYAALAKMADELVLMAYDYGTDAERKKPQPNGLVDQAIKLTLDSGVRKDKLLLALNLDAENETTVGDKLGLAKRYGLAGAAVWRLGIFTEAEKAAVNASVVKKG
ncbi:stalk domain-containing protein [Cohnella nanjingensis]|uniref:Copper amine oxidase n=1 Tax=Cohnella nanjingensis TaxID=1387779 RepID=A0A7X0VCU9_9BACL|nr:stalk domain-containing protein [Cohnella nanjingensis]MBB6669280.1 copper amine oxidase [Cohnella nanjingensis]